MREDVRTVGRYRLGAELGTGGFATVYRAQDPVLDRPVALKVLHPHLARDPATRERFVREGRALARVRHPGVVQIFDAGQADGVAYLAMELIEGRSLSTVIQDDGPLDLARTLDLVQQLAAALDALHHRHLVHRDVKPANVLVEEVSGRAVLLDFGVARALDSATLTATTSVIGTPGFMAPEQVEPGGQPAAQTDVYQLAATAYAMLAGHPPFEGDATRAIYAIVHGAPPDLAAARPDVPPAVGAAIAHGLAKDPAQRPPGPRAFATELEAAVSSRAAPPARAPAVPVARAPRARTGVQETAATIAAAPPAAGTAPAAEGRPPALSTAAGNRLDQRRAAPPPGAGAGRLVLVLAAVAVLTAVTAGAVLLTRTGDGEQAGSSQAAVTARAGIPATAGPSPVGAVPTAAAQPTRAAETPRPAASPSPRQATAAPTAAPAAGDVADLLRTAMSGRGYTPDGPVVQARALASGGTLSVQKGICRDSADGACQALFIFVDQRFLGTDWATPSRSITDLRALDTGRFAATYASYADGDANCCPSGQPVTVTFTWDGSRLRPDRYAPGHQGE